MTIFYFTGTGNSLFAARKIAEKTDAKLVSIPQAIGERREYTDDCIGFVYPQYANGLPKMVRSFVLTNRFNAEYFFAVDLYSFIHIGALGELAGIIPLNYGGYLKTPCNFTFLINPPKNPREVLAKAESRLAEIAGDILERKIMPVKPHTGEGNATKYFGEAKFKVTDQCTKCGTCARVCPAGNIAVDNSVVFGNACENCFACVNLCPAHAIYSSRAVLRRRQYRNPVIPMEEIAAVNERRDNPSQP